MTRISIIVPFHNPAYLLRESLCSAAEQELISVEIVAIDDGSTDNSLAIARGFEPVVRVLTGPNRGVAAARNRGIAETTGEWIVFLDADDLLLPGTLRKRLGAAEITGADVLICDWQDLLNYGDSTADGPVRSVDMKALAADAEIACATHVWATTAALMYRRTLVERIGGFREDLSVIQDARFLFDAAYYGARFARSPHIGARYRVLLQSLSRRDPARFWRDVFRNGKQIEALWRTRGALQSNQLAALSDICNGAAHGLFRAADPSFREVLAALRGSQLPISWGNRLAELISDIAGQPCALQMAGFWTKSRRFFTGMDKDSSGDGGCGGNSTSVND